MRTLISILTIAFICTGCVSTKTKSINLNTVKVSKPVSIIKSHREKPSFAAVTAMNVQFGLLGAAVQMANGNKIINENEVSDPAIYIADELAKALSTQLEINDIKTSSTPVDTSNIKTLAEKNPGADLLIDVQTVNWQFIYYVSDWNNYRVMYSAKLRLIDTRNQTLLAESFCNKMQDDKANSPSYDQMIANKAAVLKAALKAHADACIAEFKTKTFVS